MLRCFSGCLGGVCVVVAGVLPGAGDAAVSFGGSCFRTLSFSGTKDVSAGGVFSVGFALSSCLAASDGFGVSGLVLSGFGVSTGFESIAFDVDDDEGVGPDDAVEVDFADALVAADFVVSSPDLADVDVFLSVTPSVLLALEVVFAAAPAFDAALVDVDAADFAASDSVLLPDAGFFAFATLHTLLILTDARCTQQP